MSSPFDVLSEQERAALEKRAPVRWTEPMLATLTDARFSDPSWIYERKLDGVRCLVFRRNDEVRILSRNRKPMNDTWPELVEALEAMPSEDFIADGEIVAFEGSVTSFQRLQRRIGITDPQEATKRGVTVYLYLFDLLRLEGYDTTGLSLRARKKLLKRSLAFSTRIRFTPHVNERGEDYYERACRKGWEGVIAKDARHTYVHGRSKKWLKFKCDERQELVIGGYTEPQGSRTGFGALLVGYYEEGELRYAGKVGTGYDDETLARLGDRLRELETEDSPFSEDVGVRKVHFVKPKLVGEFGFTEWTSSGKLRHPRFIGLRVDKKPREVRRERPVS